MFGQGRPIAAALIAALVCFAAARSPAAEELRAPTDSLRIVTNRNPLIFAPGEQFTFDLEPVLQGVEPSTTIDIATTLTPARGRTTLWNTQQRLPVPVDGPAVATLHVPMPRTEGVYDIRLLVTRPSGFRERFLPGGAGAPLVERTFQVVVLDRSPTPVATDAEWRSVMEIDPTNQAWSTRLPDWTQIRRLPGIPKRPIGSVRTTAVTTDLGVFVELPSTPANTEPHWQAYPLALESTGTPHLLEIEYPNDREQHLAISIVEPDASGRFVTIGRESGVYVEGLGATERVDKQKHRLVFWPRTNAPLVLVMNQHPAAAGRFGKIRIFKRTSTSIATEPWPLAQPAGRLVAAYLARPLNGDPLNSLVSDNPLSIPPSDDWQTYFEGASQLAEYLNYSGYNAAVVNVAPDGHPIYSSRRTPITPLAANSDVPPSDGLELMLRIFDRNGLALVPSLEFVAPLPELEALRQRLDPKTAGIELVGPGGLTWLEAHSGERGLTPHYNLLDDRVQQAMLEVAGELVERYRRHPSFAALAVPLSARGYAVLPDLEWGIDDTTIACFESDTGVRLPDDGSPNRFAAREELLTTEYADAWRAWRAAQVTRFYQRLAELVTSTDGNRRILLTTEDLWAAPEAAAKIRPNVVAKLRLDRTMLDMGIDSHALTGTRGIEVLPTRYVESMVPLVDRALDLAVNDAFATDEQLSSSALFYHRPQRHNFSSFAALTPFTSKKHLLTQSAAHGAAMRRPYIASLADDDPRVILDGGEQLPLGQEDAVRRIRSIVRALPLTPADKTLREQNVTVRTYRDGNELVCVVANECPWHADVTVDVTTPVPAQAAPLVPAAANSGAVVETFNAGRQLWSLQLAPYDVHAVRFNSVGLQFESVQSQISDEGQQELAAKVAELNDRDLTAAPQYSVLRNPSFEPINAGEQLPGWRLVGDPSQTSAELDATLPQQGNTCLYLQNRGNGTATLESNTFATPPTGKLMIWVFVRGANVAPNTELRIGFEVDDETLPYRKFTTLGGSASASHAVPTDWGSGFLFCSEDLPLDSRGKMRLKFELTGTGEIWIDNVQLHDLLYPIPFYQRSEAEKLALVKLKSAAGSAFENGRLAECVDRLDGYWPRYLNAYTPTVAPPMANQTPPATEPQPATTTEQEAEVPSVGKSWYSLPRFWK